MKSNEGALRPRMAAALLLVLFRGNMEVGSQSQTSVTSNADNTAGWEKAHGARDDPKAASFRRARNAPWAALADCIMPPNLLGQTTSGHNWGPHKVATLWGKEKQTE